MIGTIQTMQIVKQTEKGYVLRKGNYETILPNDESKMNLEPNEEVDVFLFVDEATLQLPSVIIGTFAWADVSEVEQSIGVHVDIGTKRTIFIPKQDLPAFPSVWPEVGDKLYVTLRVTKRGELFAVPAKERQFQDLFTFASDIELNDQVEGVIIRAAREGSVMITTEQYRVFIHRTERETEPRLGERVKARVIEVKEDGTLNGSLKPLKHKRMDQDAENILAILQHTGGEMDFGDRSSPEEIKKTFQMSKSAFKRALGKLMKQQIIEQIDGEKIVLKK